MHIIFLYLGIRFLILASAGGELNVGLAIMAGLMLGIYDRMAKK